MSVYCTLFSQTFYGLLFCYLTITDVTLYLQIIDFQFPSCCTSQLNRTITVNSSTNTPITKKITLARFACLCFTVWPILHTLTHYAKCVSFFTFWAILDSRNSFYTMWPMLPSATLFSVWLILHNVTHFTQLWPTFQSVTQCTQRTTFYTAYTHFSQCDTLCKVWPILHGDPFFTAWPTV